jgi:hypothetical protein
MYVKQILNSLVIFPLDFTYLFSGILGGEKQQINQFLIDPRKDLEHSAELSTKR